MLTNFYRSTNIYDLEILDNETTALWFIYLFIFWNLHGGAFYFLNFVKWGKYKASILLILRKCNCVGCSNGNQSFTGRLFSSYGPLNILFHFFRYLIYSVFHNTFVKKFMKKLSFFSSNFKNSVQDVVYYRKLGCLTLWTWNGDPLNIRYLLSILIKF